MQISKPTFGVATLPFPDMATITPVWVSADVTTLGGKTRRDVMARKYQYVLQWRYIKVDAYDALEAIVNTLSPATFVYGKWPQSSTPGVSCLGSLSQRRLEVGTGDSSYYSSVTLTLTEVNSRI
jgi:hypothetical protein